MTHVLVIEDHPKLLESIVRTLKESGFDASGVETLKEAAGILTPSIGLVVLDLMLPDGSGLDWLAELRKADNRVPVLILTARDTIKDRVTGLDVGADDYLVKPFELKELLARMRAIERRQHGQTRSLLMSADMMLDLATLELEYKSIRRLLSSREFALMRVLMQRPGRIFSRAQIEQQIYGWGEEVESNAVDVLIHSIRKRFDKEIIRNIRGAGWMVLKDTR